MMDLYADWAKVYDYFFPDRADEIAFWSRQAEPHGRCVLDLMCGTAEVSLGLARDGLRVWGVDCSPAMLAVAASRLAAAADYPARRLSLLQGDACALPLGGATFDFALVGGNGSFNHLAGDEMWAAVRELRRVLRPDGGLGLELVNPYLLPEIDAQRAFGPFRATPPGVWVEKTSVNRFDAQAGLFHIQQATRYEIGGERGEFEESFALHVLAPDEINRLLRAAGFRRIRCYGSYNLEPFDRWSADLIVVAR